MGQFEIKGEKIKELIPDAVELSITVSLSDNYIEDNNTAIEKSKEKLKEAVVKLTEDIKGISNKCSISFTDLSFVISLNKLDKDTQDPQGKLFLAKKKYTRHVNVKAETKLILNIDIHEGGDVVLKNVLKTILDNTSVVSSYYRTKISNIEEEHDKLKAEVSKKCREDAEVIIKNLGADISGISRVLYNSTGDLLDTSFRPYIEDTFEPYVNSSFGGLSDFDDCDEWCDDDEDLFSKETAHAEQLREQYNETWAEGFANKILEGRYTIKDDITVVFEIG